MVEIEKPETVPRKLQTDGTDEREALEVRYEEDRESFAEWIRSGAFDRRIFSHDSVRGALQNCQHEKCCYCEKGREHVHEVEHFRPKKAVRQSVGEANKYPGYYWLAYEWTNLLMACRHCNGRKGTVFPLRNPADRAQSHHDDIADENPLLVKPDREDPSDHLFFREHVVVGKTDKGNRTIEVLGLNRDSLTSDRREAYEVVDTLLDVVKLGGPTADEAREMLERRQRADAEFSTMVQEAVEGAIE